ncbi:unnamed protein product [Rhizophagus irregularis]|nr:unnamed protein product [Rhizophagus irregularis]
MRSATAIIMGTIIYEAPVIKEVTQKESSPGKHIINLEDISLISMNRSSTNTRQLLEIIIANESSAFSRLVAPHIDCDADELITRDSK